MASNPVTRITYCSRQTLEMHGPKSLLTPTHADTPTVQTEPGLTTEAEQPLWSPAGRRHPLAVGAHNSAPAPLSGLADQGLSPGHCPGHKLYDSGRATVGGRPANAHVSSLPAK